MPNKIFRRLHSLKVINIKGFYLFYARMCSVVKVSLLKRLRATSYNFCTGFPQNLWKIHAFRAFSCVCALLLCCSLATSCMFFKSTKKDQGSTATESKKAKQKEKSTRLSKRALDSYLIDKDDEEVLKRFGEPTIVSRLADNRIMWTYRPSWKLMLDNKDTIYIEFENGKVTKIFRTTK